MQTAVCKLTEGGCTLMGNNQGPGMLRCTSDGCIVSKRLTMTGNSVNLIICTQDVTCLPFLQRTAEPSTAVQAQGHNARALQVEPQLQHSRSLAAKGKLQAASTSSHTALQAQAGRGCPKAYQLLTGASLARQGC